MTERNKQAVMITNRSLLVNLILVVIKIMAGIFGKSSAMVADGIHSFSDAISDLLLLFGFKFSDQPPDKTHNYGHGKIETLLAAIVSILIIATAVPIFINSSSLILDFLFKGGRLQQPTFVALIAAIVSIVVKESLFHITKRIADKTDNCALLANAWHHRSDSISSIATLFGIGGAVLLGNRWIILDPIAALFVAFFILAIGAKMLVNSVKEMLEASVGEEKEREIRDVISSVEGVVHYCKLRTRTIGNYFALDVQIEVSCDLNIVQAHDIATKVENRLHETFGENNLISIHIEPHDLT